jgi:hypothetical protein
MSTHIVSSVTVVVTGHGSIKPKVPADIMHQIPMRAFQYNSFSNITIAPRQCKVSTKEVRRVNDSGIESSPSIHDTIEMTHFQCSDLPL